MNSKDLRAIVDNAIALEEAKEEHERQQDMSKRYHLASPETPDIPTSIYHVSALTPFIRLDETVTPAPVRPLQKRGRLRKDQLTSTTCEAVPFRRSAQIGRKKKPQNNNDNSQHQASPNNHNPQIY
ncbi:hypothetical protein CBL_05129 [Carabus blaptoides fortunei]